MKKIVVFTIMALIISVGAVIASEVSGDGSQQMLPAIEYGVTTNLFSNALFEKNTNDPNVVPFTLIGSSCVERCDDGRVIRITCNSDERCECYSASCRCRCYRY
jgi:hypothetical protein